MNQKKIKEITELQNTLVEAMIEEGIIEKEEREKYQAKP